jgi:hypothetical protein
VAALSVGQSDKDFYVVEEGIILITYPLICDFTLGIYGSELQP